MTSDACEREIKLDRFTERLLETHGPLMTGAALWHALGFSSAASFRKARSRGQIGIDVFRVKHRRGSFAYTCEVGRWLAELK